MKKYSRCQFCKKSKATTKFELCRSCSQLNNTCHQKYEDMISVKDNPLYNLYLSIMHHKINSNPNLNVEEFVTATLPEMRPNMLLINPDMDEPFSLTNYRFVKRKQRGLARKQAKASDSDYIGAVVKFKDTDKEYWYAMVKGKYVPPTYRGLTAEVEAARNRDRYCIKQGLDYRLNFT